MRNRNKIDFEKLGWKILTFVAMALPFTAYADLPQPGCGQLNGVSCGPVAGPNDLIVKAINIILGIAALVAVLMIVIGGFRYIISNGNEEEAKKGRKIVINALIGLVIIILAYAAVSVVNHFISNAANGGNTSGL